MMAARQPLRLISAAPRSHLFTTARITTTTRTTITSTQTLRTFGSSRSSRQDDNHQKSSQTATSVQRTTTFSSSARTTAEPHTLTSSPFSTGPSPPRLPKEEQEIFERLQRQSTGAFSTPRSAPSPAPPSSSPPETLTTTTRQAPAQPQTRDATAAVDGDAQNMRAAIRARGDGEELHPNVRRGAQPEFEGDVNPKTGEVGGPKNEPLRWGAAGEWSYNGRTTDF